ncbi:MAG TPA: hypothetical protein VEA69_13405 [Tepidisphaeraceae bacterium]|nr:hypothetical protein [Tepidisphaeraceae bacterium]
MTKKLFTTVAALALGSTAFMSTPAQADWRDYYRDRSSRDYRDRDWRDHDGRFGRDVDYNISMSEVPYRVRETLDRELGRLQRRVEQVWFVRRDGKEFYRFQVDRRGNDDLSFRISPDGRLLSVQEVNDRFERRY